MAFKIHRDGYTERGYIKTIHGDGRFVYRPTRAIDESEHVAGSKEKEGAAWHQHCAERMVKHLVSWDAVDESGEAVPITAENLNSLPGLVFWKIYNIIAGFDLSDEDPEWDEEAKTRHSQTKKLIEEAATIPGVAREAIDAKNSTAA